MNIANKLTLLRIVLIPVFIVFYYINIPYWNYYATLIFIIAALTDLFDGRLARKRDIVSNFGKLMDPIADKLLVSSALILLVDWGHLNAVIAIVLIGREFIVSGLRLVAAAEGKVLAADTLGKLKTVVQIIAICALLLEDGFFALWNIPFGFVMILLSVVLSVWSAVNYFVKNREIVAHIFKK